ncbi:MAG: putative serine/threonine-protein kinase pknB [Planctomycetota bacterium]|nr:putative serine/threonine-protein kinase pknB [Planctomycetota bacterium]
MTLDPDRVQAVFLAALATGTPGGRTAVLDRECAADDVLRHRVEALLMAHDRPDRLLDRPFVLPGVQAAAARVQPTDMGDGVNPLPSDAERMS